ncbi:formin-like protein 20 [Choloepus didactylus]|uniref:formin-like protein 20 n=1 Tax=Choloepus didactylus TaxID=27675 RepID=UPI00189CD80B|nr:formin-like protein 20 [Choloepus didactylus]
MHRRQATSSVQRREGRSFPGGPRWPEGGGVHLIDLLQPTGPWRTHRGTITPLLPPSHFPGCWWPPAHGLRAPTPPHALTTHTGPPPRPLSGPRDTPTVPLSHTHRSVLPTRSSHRHARPVYIQLHGRPHSRRPPAHARGHSRPAVPTPLPRAQRWSLTAGAAPLAVSRRAQASAPRGEGTPGSPAPGPAPTRRAPPPAPAGPEDVSSRPPPRAGRRQEAPAPGRGPLAANGPAG